MAFALYFNPTGMSTDRYDAVIRALEEAGQGSPAGRTYHFAFGDPAKLQVFDIWETMEQFESFGQTLMPILQQQGVDPGEPMQEPVHNIIIG